MTKRSCMRAGLLALATAALAATPTIAAADTVKVNQDGDAGWDFARDQNNAVPYEMSLAQRSIGAGSLSVPPIAGAPARKFIAEQVIAAPASSVSAIAFDFLIAGNGTPADANDFYLNVYTLLPGTAQTYYDCRFDYTATLGSTTGFTTAAFTAAGPPTGVAKRAGTASCPATLAEMPEGTTIPFYSLNVGQGSDSDTGLGGYLDNVVIAGPGGTTTYDFDPLKDACKSSGFALGGFKNQGACIAAALN